MPTGRWQRSLDTFAGSDPRSGDGALPRLERDTSNWLDREDYGWEADNVELSVRMVRAAL